MSVDPASKDYILILDNSVSLMALYKAELEELGEQTALFRKGAEALAYALKSPPKLCVIGAELEDINCLQLIEHCHTSGICHDIPFIVISSSDSIEFREQCFKLGVADFIPRNAKQDYLIQHIQTVLERIEAQRLEGLLAKGGVQVLVAEDSQPIGMLYKMLLGEMGAHAILCADGQEALDRLLADPEGVDILITDLEMPRLSGQQLVQRLREDARFDALPIIVVTRFEALETAVDLLRSGATDYIHKPFRPEELKARISTHLQHSRLVRQHKLLAQQLRELNDSLEQKISARTADLSDANQEMMLKLALVCDFKDQDTGNHINRVRLYCQELARAAGIPEEELEHFGYSSMLHDVGKVGIPDSILKKPGPLNTEEWAVMRTHTSKGAQLLGDREFFRIAREIAQSHHERMDGTGYPDGLKGEEIPLSARIAAVVDVYDALTSKRCYKEAWTIDEALAELQHMSTGHLDPNLVDLMERLQRQGQLDYIPKLYP